MMSQPDQHHHLIAPPSLDLVHEREHALELYGVTDALRDELRLCRRVWARRLGFALLRPALVFLLVSLIHPPLLGWPFALLVVEVVGLVLFFSLVVGARYHHVRDTRTALTTELLPPPFSPDGMVRGVSFNARFRARAKLVLRDNLSRFAFLVLCEVLLLCGGGLLVSFELTHPAGVLLLYLAAIPVMATLGLIVLLGIQLIEPSPATARRVHTELVMNRLRSEHHTLEGALSMAKPSSGEGEGALSLAEQTPDLSLIEDTRDT